MASKHLSSKKIHILHLMNIDVGVCVHLRNQLVYLRSKGFEVAAVCSPGDYIPSDTLTADGISVKTIKMTRQISPLRDLLSIFQLYRYFCREKFDIVHTHSLKPGLLGRVAAFLAGIPIRIHTIHGFRFHNQMLPVEKKLYIILERIGNWFGHISLSQGLDDIQVAIQEKICRPDQIFYLGNGIDVKQFTTPVHQSIAQAKKRSLGISPNEKVVGIVGRQTKIKGYLEFIEAAKIVATQFSQVKFIMVGPPEEGNPDSLNVSDLIRQHNLEEIALPLGRRDDMRELYEIMDVMVLPSWLEGVPRVLIEASICGNPIIASDIPGNREVVQHGLSGLLVPVGDVLALTSAILDLLTHEGKATEMGKAGKRRSLELFDERKCFERLIQIYEDMLRAKLSAFSTN